MERDGSWACMYRADYRETYLTIIKDLTPPPKPPAPPPPPPPPPRDYGKVNDSLNDFADIDKDNIKFSGKGAWGTTAMSGVTDLLPITGRSTVASDELIAKNLRIIKSNLNILQDDYSFYSRMFFNFDRYKVALPDYHLTKTFSRVFFTRPSLHLINASDKSLTTQCKNDPLYHYLYKNNRNIVLSLTDHLTTQHDFLPFLCNCAKSFEVSDEYIKTVEHGETLTGYKVQYGTSNIDSRTAGTFSVSYTDDKNYSIYKVHKAWVDYISRVYRGEFYPHIDSMYKKILDYACSVYYVVCAEDGETILFWTKYWGVFPTNIPSSTSSWTSGNLLKTPDFSVNYAYSFKEDFTPLILAELNMNSKSEGGIRYRRTYEDKLGSTGPTFAGPPFVESATDNNGQHVYKLKFKHE